MKLSVFEQAGLLLSGLGIKDENLIDEAIRVVEKCNGYKNALREASEYDFMSGTKILFKLLDATKDDDEVYMFARHCSGKFHSINSYFSEKSRKEGNGFNEMIDSSEDFTKAFNLTPREAWTLFYANGREFIKNIRFMKDGEEVIKKLIPAIIRADKQIENEKTMKLTGQAYNNPQVNFQNKLIDSIKKS